MTVFKSTGDIKSTKNIIRYLRNRMKTDASYRVGEKINQYLSWFLGLKTPELISYFDIDSCFGSDKEAVLNLRPENLDEGNNKNLFLLLIAYSAFCRYVQEIGKPSDLFPQHILRRFPLTQVITEANKMDFPTPSGAPVRNEVISNYLEMGRVFKDETNTGLIIPLGSIQDAAFLNPHNPNNIVGANNHCVIVENPTIQITNWALRDHEENREELLSAKSEMEKRRVVLGYNLEKICSYELNIASGDGTHGRFFYIPQCAIASMMALDRMDLVPDLQQEIAAMLRYVS